VLAHNERLRALVDTGCTRSVIAKDAAERLGLPCRPARRIIHMLDGTSSLSQKQCAVTVVVGGQCIALDVLVAGSLVAGCDLLLGLDGIEALGGVTVRHGNAEFAGCTHNAVGASAVTLPAPADGLCPASSGNVLSENLGHAEMAESGPCDLSVEEDDFCATFHNGRWTVRWKWKGEPPTLHNKCGEYSVRAEDRDAYEAEMCKWIDEGFLVPHDPVVHGKVDAVIPMMAVSQPNKGKVRPVMDYRELNEHVESRPGTQVDVCGEKLRAWRRMGADVSLLDLRKAYLQLHVGGELLRFQAVRYKGQLFVMTRMGFGLNAAPKIMSRVLGKVLSMREDVRMGTDSYIDDIVVNRDVVPVAEVRELLRRYGLVTKDPVPLDGARVLGLHVVRDGAGEYRWRRDNELPTVGDSVPTKRQLFSVCGQLVGHYPVAGWLRVACSYLKRVGCGGAWDARVQASVGPMLRETLRRVGNEDPVCGIWNVSGTTAGRVWCDASSLAVGVCLEVDGHVVEDASWLRKMDDGAHINVAELDAVLKGINLALKWGMKTLEVITDSASVFGWVSSVVEDTHRPRVSGLGEMLIRRRLGMVTELVDAYGLSLSMRQVPSALNLADALTRVPKKWLVKGAYTACAGVTDVEPESRNDGDVALGVPGVPAEGVSREMVERSHSAHHLGIRRTLFISRKQFGAGVTEQAVRGVIKDCQACRRVDPAPVQWERGTLSVSVPWKRLATDITHYEGRPYLTVVDCGPGRFAIWRRLTAETADAVGSQLQLIFNERGAPEELLSDNGPCFRSRMLEELLASWQVRQVFSCAYRPSGNGIVERNHRTIKRMAARTGRTVADCAFWYNVSPNDSGIVPMDSVLSYEACVPGSRVVGDGDGLRADALCPYKVGDLVYVKPPDARCTTSWVVREVTAILSSVSVEVGGTPRHVRDLRHASSDICPPAPGNCSVSSEPDECNVVPIRGDASFTSSSESGDNDSDDSSSRTDEGRPVRQRCPPVWMRDFDMSSDL